MVLRFNPEELRGVRRNQNLCPKTFRSPGVVPFADRLTLTGGCGRSSINSCVNDSFQNWSRSEVVEPSHIPIFPMAFDHRAGTRCNGQGLSWLVPHSANIWSGEDAMMRYFRNHIRCAFFSWDFTSFPGQRLMPAEAGVSSNPFMSIQAYLHYPPIKLVGMAGVAPAASRFRAGPSATDITFRWMRSARVKLASMRCL